MKLKENNALVAAYCRVTGERNTQAMRLFAAALDRLSDGFYRAGQKAAKRGDPCVSVDCLRQYLARQSGGSSAALDELSELLYQAYTAGYGREVKPKWTS